MVHETIPRRVKAFEGHFLLITVNEVVLACESVVKFFWDKSETVLTKSTQQYFSLVLFIMLCKLLLTFKTVTIQTKAAEQYFPASGIVYYWYAVQSGFESVNEIL